MLSLLKYMAFRLKMCILGMRSLLFYISFLIFGVLFFLVNIIISLIVFFHPVWCKSKFLQRTRMSVPSIFVYYIIPFLCGIHWRIIGEDNLPPCLEGYIVAANHESVYETMLLTVLLQPITTIAKRELLWLPFFGVAWWLMGTIFVKRESSKSGYLVFSQACKKLLAGGAIFLFPEGTRRHLEDPIKLQKGAARLAQFTQSSIIPIVHDAGKLWSRNSFLKWPGTVTVVIGSAIPFIEGQTAVELTQTLQQWMNEQRKLLD